HPERSEGSRAGPAETLRSAQDAKIVPHGVELPLGAPEYDNDSWPAESNGMPNLPAIEPPPSQEPSIPLDRPLVIEPVCPEPSPPMPVAVAAPLHAAAAEAEGFDPSESIVDSFDEDWDEFPSSRASPSGGRLAAGQTTVDA